MPRSIQYGVLALAQVAVGAAAIFARYGLSGAGALAVSASRLTIAALVLLAIAAIPRRPSTAQRAYGARAAQDDTLAQRDTLKVSPTLVGAGVALAAHFALWIWSLEYTSVAVSTLLVATTPVWTALYDAVVHRRMLSPLAIFSGIAGGAGVYAVVAGSFGRPPVTGHEALGAALAIGGAIAIAAYFLIVRSVRADYDTRALVTQTYTSAAAVLIIASAIAHQAPPALNDAPAWFGILGMALISQLLGHTAMNAALKWFTPSAVAFTTLLEPVSAAGLAFLIFREGLNALAIVGAMVLLCAVGVFLREESRFDELSRPSTAG